MQVICLEDAAFYQLVKDVVAKLKLEDSSQQMDWIDGEAAMTLLGIKKSTLQNLRNEGLIRFSQPSRKVILYYKPSLIEYLEKNAKETF